MTIKTLVNSDRIKNYQKGSSYQATNPPEWVSSGVPVPDLGENNVIFGTDNVIFGTDNVTYGEI